MTVARFLKLVARLQSTASKEARAAERLIRQQARAVAKARAS